MRNYIKTVFGKYIIPSHDISSHVHDHQLYVRRAKSDHGFVTGTESKKTLSLFIHLQRLESGISYHKEETSRDNG